MQTNNIPSLKNIPIRDILFAKFGVPIYIENDANCYALGASLAFSQDIDVPFIGITLGTGLGCGIVCNGRIIRGQHTSAGEIWQLPHNQNRFEELVSSKFFRAHDTNAKECAELAEHGNHLAHQIFEEFAQNLAHVLYYCYVTYDPHIICLGGSIAKSSHLFLERTKELLNEKLPESVKHSIHIYQRSESKTIILGTAQIAKISPLKNHGQ
ncbi:MAG: ROK family protein [Candidatus Woesearchaeota archaeon]